MYATLFLILGHVSGYAVNAKYPLTAHSRTMRPLMATSEDEAKTAWLAKLDAPAWGRAAAALTEAAVEATSMAELSDQCTSGKFEACEQLSSEEEAKKAWLAKLDTPAWGTATAVVSKAVATAVEATSVGPLESRDDAEAWVTESAAKQAWLAKLDGPSWGKAAAALTEAAVEATTMAELSAECVSGMNEACQTLTVEKDAQVAWWMATAGLEGTRNAEQRRAARRAAQDPGRHAQQAPYRQDQALRALQSSATRFEKRTAAWRATQKAAASMY